MALRPWARASSGREFAHSHRYLYDYMYESHMMREGPLSQLGIRCDMSTIGTLGILSLYSRVYRMFLFHRYKSTTVSLSCFYQSFLISPSISQLGGLQVAPHSISPAPRALGSLRPFLGSITWQQRFDVICEHRWTGQCRALGARAAT